MRITSSATALALTLVALVPTSVMAGYPRLATPNHGYLHLKLVGNREAVVTGLNEAKEKIESEFPGVDVRWGDPRMVCEEHTLREDSCLIEGVFYDLPRISAPTPPIVPVASACPSLTSPPATSKAIAIVNVTVDKHEVAHTAGGAHNPTAPKSKKPCPCS